MCNVKTVTLTMEELDSIIKDFLYHPRIPEVTLKCSFILSKNNINSNDLEETFAACNYVVRMNERVMEDLREASKTIKATRNQLSNTKNPYQGNAAKVLCVCSAGVLRSPTLANVLHDKLKYNTRAVGSEKDYALIPVTEALVVWADEIVFVNHETFYTVERNYSKMLVGKRIVILDIPDDYSYGSEILKEICYEQYLKANASIYEVKNES